MKQPDQAGTHVIRAEDIGEVLGWELGWELAPGFDIFGLLLFHEDDPKISKGKIGILQ